MYNKYELPPELQEEHVDALIIFSKDSEDDEERAERLRDSILKLTFDNGNTGKAVFLDDAVPYVTSQIDRLDEAVKFATQVFVIYSKTLNKDSVILRSSQAILWHTIEDETKLSFIPVIHGKHTSESMMVKLHTPINTGRRNWEECLKIRIQCRLGERITRTIEHERKQQEFWRNSSLSIVTSNTTTSHPQIEPARCNPLTSQIEENAQLKSHNENVEVVDNSRPNKDDNKTADGICQSLGSSDCENHESLSKICENAVTGQTTVDATVRESFVAVEDNSGVRENRENEHADTTTFSGEVIAPNDSLKETETGDKQHGSQSLIHSEALGEQDVAEIREQVFELVLDIGVGFQADSESKGICDEKTPTVSQLVLFSNSSNRPATLLSQNSISSDVLRWMPLSSPKLSPELNSNVHPTLVSADASVGKASESNHRPVQVYNFNDTCAESASDDSGVQDI